MMKHIMAGAGLALALAGPVLAQTSQADTTRDIATKYYTALIQGDVESIRKYGSPDYIQHNPAVPTGLEAVIKFFGSRPRRPDAQLSPVRTIAEGDKVMFLTRSPGGPGSPPGSERAVIDIFRVENGKVAEHWDYMETFPNGNQRGPNPPANSNGVF